MRGKYIAILDEKYVGNERGCSSPKTFARCRQSPLSLNLCIIVIVFVCFLISFHATILVFLSSIPPSLKLVIHFEPNSFDMHKALLWNHGIMIILIDLKYQL